ncbi:ATP-binding protein [Actinomadura mexicana]|uniref:Anti-sigma regulatory factor (Ser/Thr protein kinase) n=1 Tax=Actinomadura mexicana TaxID=134959 RepID=A0A238V1Y2_9ACTN|nr:ATP-binding protein [Actinomadura mexicana]SNR27593.1 Anti-sigma regulatory factor (Ser/Thr protein kinase) [Actinomadura mexicana]
MIDSGTTTEGVLIESSEQAPQQARCWVADVFAKRRLGDDYTARTVVTELVTNAYRHTDTKAIPVRLVLENGYFVVEVEDRSDLAPVLQGEDDAAESGRGLLMVAMLVDAWGVRALDGGGKVTWARLRA